MSVRSLPFGTTTSGGGGLVRQEKMSGVGEHILAVPKTSSHAGPGPTLLYRAHWNGVGRS
ncbi:MAG: hypothetical protein ACLP7F_22245 [Acidimicrobiales bacterium]